MAPKRSEALARHSPTAIPLILLLAASCGSEPPSSEASLPNIVLILADDLGFELPDDAAEDSYNFLEALTGQQGRAPVREYTLHQTNQLALAIRRGPWKYLDHQGSGGNDYNREALQPYVLPEKAPDAPGQLYNLEADPGETTNLYFEHPEIVKQLKTQLDEFVSSGRSAPARDPSTCGLQSQ